MWIEGAILGSNIVTSSFFFSSCNPESVILLVAYIISTLSLIRLMNRVIEFKKFNFIIMRCSHFCLHYLAPFIILGVFIAVIGFSVFNGHVLSCHDARGQEHLTRAQCASRNLPMTRHLVHFDSIQNSLFTYYILIDRSMWYEILPMILDSPGLHTLYKGVALCFVYCLAAFGTFLLRGVTLSVCYVSLEKFASVRMDKNITLTKPQVEWIQTEEMFSDIELLRKLPTPHFRFSKWCFYIKESTTWAVIYYFAIVIGFLFNITQ